MNVLIIEDEAAAARRLAKLILEVDPKIHLLDYLDSIEATVLWMSKEHPPVDLVFMDIHLADGSSFEIFEHVSFDAPVVFTTAYDEYAVQAFKVNALDYILKPIKKQELAESIERYKKQQSQQTLDYRKIAELLQPEQKNLENKRMLIRLGQTIKVVDLTKAAYFYTEDKITFMVNEAGKRYPIDHSLEKLESLLSVEAFFRVNRQYIINIKSIKEMYTYSKSRVRIDLQPASHVELIVSTERSSRFKKWLLGEK